MWPRRLAVCALLIPATVSAEAETWCSLDKDLSAAAARLLQAKKRPETEALTRAVRAAGSDAVSVRALWMQGEDKEKVRAWLEEFRRQADAPVICGEAALEDTRLVIATARGGSLERLGPDSIEIRGRLERGFKRPELVIMDASGRLLRFEVTARALRTGIRLDPDMARPARVQLIARGSGGPRPIAERVLPRSDGTEDTAKKSPDDSVAAAGDTDPAMRLAELRRARGVPAVRINTLMAKVATEHAKAICETGRIVHELQPGEDPERRLARAGIRAQGVGEALAHAENVDLAMQALQRSPSHLMTMVERRFTDAGIGVAEDRNGKKCVVILLAIWPRFVGSAPP